ncbi:MAG: Rha family transcriptional regulator [Magnetococcales bacterium]|nr:Rha family transcriptional regulator [Magnetococcales bacterium]
MNATNSQATSTSTVTKFTFGQEQIRIINRNDEPWFVAADVCKAVGIGNTADATDKIDLDEKGLEKIQTPGGPQNVVVVSESGLNIIILRCHDAITPGTPAHRFRKWVTSEVLPSIRKTGTYKQHAEAPPEKQDDIVCMSGYSIVNGQIIISSVDIAVKFGKRHDALLRTIRNLDCSLEFRRNNFFKAVREIHVTGHCLREEVYNMTRDGFLMLCMKGFTGRDAARRKEEYIEVFNNLDAETRQSRQASTSDPMMEMMDKVVSVLETLVARSAPLPGSDKMRKFAQIIAGCEGLVPTCRCRTGCL